MHFSKLDQSDLSKIGHLRPEGWPDIVSEFCFYVDESFCHPIKVAHEKRIVGLGCLIRFGKTAWVAHVIVDKRHRQKGIGKKIVEYLLSLDTTIQTYSLIATATGEQLYKKFGFEVVSDYLHYKRKAPLTIATSTQSIRCDNAFQREEIAALDKMITGEDRRPLLSMHVDSALVVRDNTVAGYYLPHAREGAVYAINPDAGKQLLKIKLTDKNDVVLPHQNSVGRQFLESLGFELMGAKGRRMILGDTLSWKPEAIYSRIGGNFG